MRAWAAWLVLAVLAVFAAGCPKRDPAGLDVYVCGLDPILPVDANGDGVVDMLVPSGGDLVAVDGVSFKRLWTRPNGSGTNCAGIKAAVGSQLLLGYDRVVDVISLRTGATEWSVGLSDRIQGLSVEGSTVRVKAIDGVTGTLDLAAHKLVPLAPSPASPRSLYSCPAFARGNCEPIDGIDFRLRDGDLAATFRFKKQGTREATVTGENGLGAQAKTTFSQVVDPNGYGIGGADLADGILYLSISGVVRAIDVRTGANLFSLTGHPRGLRVRGGRLFVETSAGKNYYTVEVFDAHTGQLLHSLGRPAGSFVKGA